MMQLEKIVSFRGEVKNILVGATKQHISFSISREYSDPTVVLEKMIDMISEDNSKYMEKYPQLSLQWRR